MTAEQIIKALECCDGTLDGCEDCPYNKDGIGCKYRLPTDVLALIKELQAHNENLKKENKYLREHMWEEVKQAEELAISDTIKRMQDELKKTFSALCKGEMDDLYRIIDQIAKEILEGKDE